MQCGGTCDRLQSDNHEFVDRVTSRYWCDRCDESYICKVKDCKEKQSCNETTGEIDCKEKHPQKDKNWLKLGDKGPFHIPWSHHSFICLVVCNRLQSPAGYWPIMDIGILSNYWCRHCNDFNRYICKVKDCNEKPTCDETSREIRCKGWKAATEQHSSNETSGEISTTVIENSNDGDDDGGGDGDENSSEESAKNTTDNFHCINHKCEGTVNQRTKEECNRTCGNLQYDSWKYGRLPMANYWCKNCDDEYICKVEDVNFGCEEYFTNCTNCKCSVKDCKEYFSNCTARKCPTNTTDAVSSNDGDGDDDDDDDNDDDNDDDDDENSSEESDENTIDNPR